MGIRRSHLLRASSFFIVLLATLSGFAQGTAFVYQGRLSENGQPANGTYDFTFTLYDSTNQPGNAFAGTVTNLGTKVIAGLFEASLDFGSAFDGAARWVEIGVRTNGTANYVTLAPRQPLTPVPYAIFAGATTNLLGALSGANIAPLTSLIADSSNALYSSLKSATGTSTLATETNAGAMSTNDFIRAQWIPDQQEGVTRLPPLGVCGYFGSFDETSWTNHLQVYGISNAIIFANATLKPFGYNYLILDEGWCSTNLDSNNLFQLHPGISEIFGGSSVGVSNFIFAIHTNGYKLGLYITSGTISPDALQAGLGDYSWTNAATLCRYHLDYLKADVWESVRERIAGILADNGFPVFFTAAIEEVGADHPGLPSVESAMLNSFRPVTGGDVTSYARLLAWTDFVMTNGWWRYVKPGHFIDMDYIGGEWFTEGGFPATKTHIIICALFSAPIIDSQFFGPNSSSLVWLTNSSLLAINQDAAVICAQRYVQSNSCDVYLKPLGSPTGPQYALGVLNRSSLAPHSITLYFTNLYPLLASGVQNWSAFDCVSNTGWVFQNTNAFTVTLGTNDSVLWRLVPNYAMTTNIIAVNYPNSMTMSVVSNGASFIAYGPWDPDASNYVARAGLTNPTEQLAAAVTVSLGKQHGWWDKFDCLYLFRGSTSNSTAQNLISTNYGIAWSPGGVSYDWSGVTGNGATGYGNTQFTPSTALNSKYSLKSASIFVYNRSTSPPNSGGCMIGTRQTARAGMLVDGSNLWAEGLNLPYDSSSINVLVDASIHNVSGPWFISRLEDQPQAGYLELFYHGQFYEAGDHYIATALPTAPIFIFATDSFGATSYQACTLSAVGIGAGMTITQYQDFLSDINTVESILTLKLP